MTTDQTPTARCSPELEAIADRGARPAQRAGWTGSIRRGGGAAHVAEAASAAITAGARLSAIADAEREGRAARPPRALRRCPPAGRARRQAQARSRPDYEQAITRAGRLGLSTPRDRRRRPGIARDGPRNPHPRHHEPERERAAGRRGASRPRATTSRSKPRVIDRPPARSERASGRRVRQAPGRAPHRAVRGGRRASRSGRSHRRRPGARSMMLPRTPTALRSPAIRAAASRPARSQSSTTDTWRPTSSRAHSGSHASSPGTAIAGSPRERALIMSGGPSTSTTHVDGSAAGWGIEPQPRAARSEHLRRPVVRGRVAKNAAQPAAAVSDRDEHPAALPPAAELKQRRARPHARLL